MFIRILAYILIFRVYYSVVIEIAVAVLGINWGAQLGYKHNSHINCVTNLPYTYLYEAITSDSV